MFKHIRNRANWSDKSSSQQGFTLIELLVVIAILGILAVVGVLSFGGLTDTAKQATSKTELTEVQTAVQAYMSKPANTTAPTSIADLVTDKDLNADVTAANMLCAYDFSAAPTITFLASQCRSHEVQHHSLTGRR